MARTVCGALLALLAAGALLGAALFADGRFVLCAAAALTLAALAEVSLMGRMTAHNLPVVLTIPLLAVVFLEHTALGARTLDPRGAPGPFAQLALEYGIAFGVAALAHTLSHGLTQAVGQQSNLRRVFLLVLGAGLVSGLAVAFERGAAPGAIVLVVLGVAAVGATTLVFEREGRRALLLSCGLAVWLVVPLPAMTQLWSHYGTRGLVALVLLSKIGDVAGYYVGRAIGRSHPFPNLSPGKTTAGCVASLVVTACLGLGLAWFGLLPDGRLGVAGGLVAGLVLNLAAQAGDLLESRVKRGAGVKDSSGWLGPAGGILDVIDSLLLSVPAALVSWPLLFGV